MDIEGGGISKEQSEKGQSGYSIIQIVIASIMLWQGSKNLNPDSEFFKDRSGPLCLDF